MDQDAKIQQKKRTEIGVEEDELDFDEVAVFKVQTSQPGWSAHATNIGRTGCVCCHNSLVQTKKKGANAKSKLWRCSSSDRASGGGCGSGGVVAHPRAQRVAS